MHHPWLSGLGFRVLGGIGEKNMQRLGFRYT